MSKLPIIGFFIRGVAEINTAELRGDYERVFLLLRIYSDCMEKKDRDKCSESRENMTKYLNEISGVYGRTYNHTLQKRGVKSTDFFNNGGRDDKLKIFQTMYKGGYISKEHFRPQTRRDNFFEQT